MQTVGISNSPSQGIALVSGIIVLFSCLANLQVRILDYSFVILLLVLLRRVSDKQPTLPTVFLSCSLIEKQLKTLPKAQQPRGLSSAYQSNLFRSYHKFKHKSWSKGLVPFTQLVKVRRVTCFWHIQASDFHETFTRSSLALNMSRKLLSDP